MHQLLSVNLIGILQSVICFGGFAVVISLAVWMTIKEGRLKRGVEIPLEDVPLLVRQTAERLAPQLEVQKVIVKYRRKDVPRKYEFHGRLDGKPIEVEVMPRESPPFVREMEVIYDTTYRRLEKRQAVGLSQVPPRVTQAAIDHMQSIGSGVKKIDRARVGTIIDQKAYELKGDWLNGRFELKVLASGEVVKVELKIRNVAAG